MFLLIIDHSSRQYSQTTPLELYNRLLFEYGQPCSLKDLQCAFAALPYVCSSALSKPTLWLEQLAVRPRTGRYLVRYP